ncbi:heterokaryon incompatibility protein-domain-containing protein [Hypoxylon rubiginosum]|uniref:Heterokaryon incompatibility protein-domain-containing protein n=1 Tax=Hypoxylon rubiginosum TaxID=110542 RepID=A0ACC0CVM6_9PEZI|nr:heterokaryon incompatibility protein-domain-containing protein [Hypoxylon rubiginosum]
MPNIYSPLPQNAVRLLRFTSDAGSQHLECELAIFPLNMAPKFNALSYCWGDVDRSSSIRCNGHQMSITPTLLEALRDLIGLDRGDIEWIWIDQICIDQTNVAERGIQVNMMKAIYTTSERTIIWLGPRINGIEAVGNLLERLSQLYDQDIDPSGTRKRRRYTTDEHKAMDLPHYKDLSWVSLNYILSRPWFVRSWVLQEAVLSKVTPQMLCGTQELPWELILRSAAWLESYLSGNWNIRSTAMPALRSLILFRESRQEGLPWDITTLLNKARWFKASEPRDRVYSLLGLIGEADESHILPTALQANYNKPVRDVFRDVTRYIIMSSRSLTILTLIRDNPDWGNYPSWVVNFAGYALWDRISYFSWSPHEKGWLRVKEISNKADGGRPVEVQQSSDDILALNGFQVDTVNAVCEVMLGFNLNSFDSHVLVALKEACHRLTDRYTTTEAIARAMMVTLTADWNLTNQERVADQPISHFWAYIREIYLRLHDNEVELKEECANLLAEAESDTTVNANIFRLHLDASHRRRVFFTKDKAYVGLGPSIMQENDILCILFGGATPMVLRPVGDCYRFVGECYVYDLMRGEGIEGWEKGHYTTKTFHLI